MSLSHAAEATRAVLKLHAEEALDGSLTIDEVVAMVREILPGTHAETVYKAIEDYGPIGEGPDGQGDMVWFKRAQGRQIPSWFYSPKTGVPLS